MRLWPTVACFALVLLLSPISIVRAGDLFIASWNVENLFDTKDDPSVELDEQFTPESPKHWTAERLEIKLNNLAQVIRKMNNGRGPDVLGLCEVENRPVVEMLVAKLAPLGRKYKIVHQDSPSDRGIDTALIYDSNVLDLIDSKFHFVDAENTRDILEARFKRHGAGGDAQSFYVFVNHWPSRGNDEWQRIMAAAVLRNRLDEILAADPKADFILVGDFNDESDNVSIARFLRASKNSDGLKPGQLYDSTASLAAAGGGTYVYDNKWELIDHMIISPGLLDNKGFSWQPQSTACVDFDEVYFQPHWQNAIKRPSASYSGTSFHKNGYSDHLAVFCIISD
jgi:predicted extracellular nuclease